MASLMQGGQYGNLSWDEMMRSLSDPLFQPGQGPGPPMPQVCMLAFSLQLSLPAWLSRHAASESSCVAGPSHAAAALIMLWRSRRG